MKLLLVVKMGAVSFNMVTKINNTRQIPKSNPFTIQDITVVSPMAVGNLVKSVIVNEENIFSHPVLNDQQRGLLDYFMDIYKNIRYDSYSDLQTADFNSY